VAEPLSREVETELCRQTHPFHNQFLNCSNYTNMKIRFAILLSAASIFVVLSGHSQPMPVTVDIPNKTIWRILDTSNSANKVLGNCSDTDSIFANILLHGIKASRISAYSQEKLETVLTPRQLDSAIACAPDTHTHYPQQVAAYGIREQWSYNKSKGMMKITIQAIAPLIFTNSRYHALYWMSFEEVSGYLSGFYIHQPGSRATEKTWQEYFESRLFSSSITKIEGNSTDKDTRSEIIKQPATSIGFHAIVWPDD
jgi:Gliding motility associated protein GldN